MLPVSQHTESSACSSHDQSATSEDISSDSQQCKKLRLGKGSHLLTTVRCLLKDSSTWVEIHESKSEKMQFMYFTPDYSKPPQYCPENPHFLWEDNQLSKGKLNKNRLTEVTVDGEKLKLHYRLHPVMV